MIFPKPKAHSQRGIALMLVLIFLVLLSALLIGFFTSVEGELQASKNYESSVTARQLINSATNIVAGQIVDGTRSTKTRRPPGTAGRIAAGERLAWASQPGMIRTWDDSGNGWKIFKLFSARDMVADFDTGNRYSTAEKLPAEVPDKWPVLPALFTDLNEPVLVEDPAGRIDRDGRKLRASYPIVDPLAMTQDKVEGFLFTTPPGYGGKYANGVPQVDATTDPTAFVGDDRTANPVPMPVVWIYVLKDGTLTVPNASTESGRTAVWDSLAPEVTPSRDNPIVGRVAFWADDETCKLNINTASEPTPWDTPRAMCKSDLDYGKFQPAQKEYQRFPGHPFTNALSPVLLPGVDLNATIKEEIYKLIPRVGTGGTMSATWSLGGAPNPVVLDKDRLFANADELLFEPKLDPSRSGQRLAITNDNTDLPNLRAVLMPDRLRRARFFLTASSRAPETNLYGQPRVSLWPVHANVARRTPFDQLAAFCSTIADATGSSASSTRGFYFQRRDPVSPRNDFSSIARNRDVYSYLQTLINLDVPGFGGNFRAKWGDDRDQVLTEIFDYIRCTNLRDPQQTGAMQFAPNGQVAPIVIRSARGFDSKGFGRFHTISQAGLHFICTYDNAQPRLGTAPAATPLGATDRVIESAFIFTPFSPSVGWPPLQEQMFIQVIFPTAGSGAFTVIDNRNRAQPLNFRNAGRALSNSIGNGLFLTGRNKGGAGGLRGTIAGLGGAVYPWISARVIVSGNAPLQFTGGTVVMKLFSGNAPIAANLVQTINITIPNGTFPVPAIVPATGGTLPARSTPATAPSFWWSLASRYSRTPFMPFLPSTAEYSNAVRCWPADSAGFAPGFKQGSIFRSEDVVRSVVPAHGDIRLIAAQTVVPGTDWVPADDNTAAQWNSATNHFAHLFVEPAGTQFSYGFLNEPGTAPPGLGLPGSRPGDQLTPANYHYSRLPEIRPGAGAAFNHWGDFDNGVAQTIDGAYINKPDEGNLSGAQGYPYWSSSFQSPTANYFSPNRLIPSAGMLGSLPTGVRRTVTNPSAPHAWETLLFRPDVSQPPGPHPGAASPPDHLLMDLFWMPVVEPYAISEPFSTAGKVNMNYEIAPFNYIHRATALVGALKGEEPLAIPTNALPGAPDGAAKIYKLWDAETADEGWLPNPHCLDAQVRRDWDTAYTGAAPFNKMRKRIDPVKTLLPFEAKFLQGQLFRSATQICEMHLPRAGSLDDGVTPELPAQYASGRFWRDHVVTGDNTRERPYANLYAKLTTRSNSFTVHIRAQVLRQIGGRGKLGWATWREDTDQQVAEYRGSTLLERYIDPADRTLADFALQPNALVDNAYRMRIVSTKKFTP